MAMRRRLHSAARGLFIGLWLLEVTVILVRPWAELTAVIRPVGAIGLVLLMLIAIPLVRPATLLVAGMATLMGAIIVATGTAGLVHLEAGLVQSLLFAGFLPTLHMLRATAQAQPRVRLSQRRFAALPAGARRDGITLGAHAFGSVLNTGSFPIMAAVMPPRADDNERRRFALAALRGMNLAPLWSPFFVAMALSSAYLPHVILIEIMPIGLTIAVLALTVSIVWYGSGGQRPAGIVYPGWVIGIMALQPIAFGLFLLGAIVVSLSVLTPLGSLETIILVVPPLCLLAIRFDRDAWQHLWRTPRERLNASYDDLMIVVAAITLAALAGQIDVTAEVIRSAVSIAPMPLAIVGLILACFLPAMIGIHPMIPTAILLAALTSGPQPLADIVLMGIALTGWSVGTMCSVSSMSVVVCAGLFRIPPWRLMISTNLGFAMVVIGIAAAVLSALQFLLSQFT